MQLDMCRCCMQSGVVMQPLFGASVDTMLTEITCLVVRPGDGLPAKICKRCLLLVSRMFTFKRQCEETDRQLRQSFHSEEKLLHRTHSITLLSSDILGEIISPADAYSGDSVFRQRGHESACRKVESDATVPTQKAEITTLVEAYASPDALSPITQSGELEEIEELYYPNNIELEEVKFDTLQLLDRGDEMSVVIKTTIPSIQMVLADVSPSGEEAGAPSSAAGGAKPTHNCTVCAKNFAHLSQLRRHQKTHLADKPHRCHVCGNTFAESSNLKKHMARHTGELRNVTRLPHLCAVCGKRFKFATSLTRHSRMHTKLKQYSCPHCLACFVERSALRVHMYAHTNRKPFVCRQCPKSFTRKVNLVRHELSHTGVKPYRCPLCDKRFTQKSYLAIHRRIHANEKPYHCGDCGMRFVASSGLAVHRRTHRPSGAYSCARCGKLFQRKAPLQRHTCADPHSSSA